jgi:hypothetical protein
VHDAVGRPRKKLKFLGVVVVEFEGLILSGFDVDQRLIFLVGALDTVLYLLFDW